MQFIITMKERNEVSTLHFHSHSKLKLSLPYERLPMKYCIVLHLMLFGKLVNRRDNERERERMTMSNKGVEVSLHQKYKLITNRIQKKQSNDCIQRNSFRWNAFAKDSSSFHFISLFLSLSSNIALRVNDDFRYIFYFPLNNDIAHFSSTFTHKCIQLNCACLLFMPLHITEKANDWNRKDFP